MTALWVKIRMYGGLRMEDDYWARFTMTGSVTDYLSYREEEKKHEGKEQAAKVESYDGKHYSNGNNTVGRAHR